MTNIVNKAKLFAQAAHMGAGQKRKFSGIQYHKHPEEVAACVRYNWNMIDIPHAYLNERYSLEDLEAVAWLHDVVEDTGVTLQDIEDYFGPYIADIVDGLTKYEKGDIVDGEIVTHSNIQRLTSQKIVKGAFEVLFVKLCDIQINLRDVMESDNDPKFAKKFTKKSRDRMAYFNENAPRTMKKFPHLIGRIENLINKLEKIYGV